MSVDLYPEEILDKVYKALYKAGLSRFDVDKAVNRMIEAGIIFSERTEVEDCLMERNREHNITQ